MLPEQGDWVTLRSNEADVGDLQPGDKGRVERVNTDKGIVDVLWANGCRTVHVSWYSDGEKRLFLSTDILVSLVDDDWSLCKARLDALLNEMKKVKSVEGAARLLATSSSDHQTLHLLWLLEVLDRETKDNDAFRKTLEDLRDHITARLEADYWQDLSLREGRGEQEEKQT